MNALVRTALGVFEVDLETEEVEASETDVGGAPAPAITLPRLVTAAAAGSTVIAVVDMRPPLAVSHDAGRTWRESGRGLPFGRAVAIAEDDPDLIVYAARNRLYVSQDGGRFWRALDVELPEIEALELRA